MPTLALPRWIPRRPQSWGLILAAVALGAFLWTQFLHSQSQARHRAVVETASRAITCALCIFPLAWLPFLLAFLQARSLESRRWYNSNP